MIVVWIYCHSRKAIPKDIITFFTSELQFALLYKQSIRLNCIEWFPDNFSTNRMNLSELLGTTKISVKKRCYLLNNRKKFGSWQVTMKQTFFVPSNILRFESVSVIISIQIFHRLLKYFIGLSSVFYRLFHRLNSIINAFLRSNRAYDSIIVRKVLWQSS